MSAIVDTAPCISVTVPAPRKSAGPRASAGTDTDRARTNARSASCAGTARDAALGPGSPHFVGISAIARSAQPLGMSDATAAACAAPDEPDGPESEAGEPQGAESESREASTT